MRILARKSVTVDYETIVGKYIGESYIALEIIDAQYDKECEGICFLASNDYRYYIPDVKLRGCNFICKQLVSHGFCDVTNYGEIQIKREIMK